MRVEVTVAEKKIFIFAIDIILSLCIAWLVVDVFVSIPIWISAIGLLVIVYSVHRFLEKKLGVSF